MEKTVLRNRFIGTKVSEEEYAQLEKLAAARGAQGGPDVPENVITLCDLCHAVVTRRWHKPWFGSAAITNRGDLEETRQEYLEFLALDPVRRRETQTRLWEIIGVRREIRDASQCTPDES